MHRSTKHVWGSTKHAWCLRGGMELRNPVRNGQNQARAIKTIYDFSTGKLRMRLDSVYDTNVR